MTSEQSTSHTTLLIPRYHAKSNPVLTRWSSTHELSAQETWLEKPRIQSPHSPLNRPPKPAHLGLPKELSSVLILTKPARGGDQETCSVGRTEWMPPKEATQASNMTFNLWSTASMDNRDPKKNTSFPHGPNLPKAHTGLNGIGPQKFLSQTWVSRDRKSAYC